MNGFHHFCPDRAGFISLVAMILGLE
jgi:hypothetical protein